MNVKELITRLLECNMEAKVYLSIDSEGNAYGTVEQGSVEQYNDIIIFYPYDEGLTYEDIFN